MGFDTIIRNGTIVTATDTYAADIGITGGQISTIAKNLPIENAAKLIDAAGCIVIPGGIDVHTHLDMPFGGTTSADDFETGTRAAAFGGTTTLIDFAIQYKGQTLRHAFDTWMKKAEGKAVADYAFSLHHHGSGRHANGRNGRAGSRRRFFLQTFYGLSRRVHDGRRHHFQGHAAGRQARRHDLHACGKWRRD